MAQILVVDDEGRMRAVLAMALDAEGYSVDEADSAEKALERIELDPPRVVITDIRLPGMSGIDLLTRVKKSSPEIECIVMTAFADAKTGIEAMRKGAIEYVVKPFETDEMMLLVKTALEKNGLNREVVQLRERESGRYRMERIVGRSKLMKELIAQAKIVAKRDTTVLIRGRSGTGKELIARGIHDESGRAPFLAVNCGAIPENLLESELFGHEKGAFTGAHAQKTGLFERASGGTIFLDEIGDIALQLQVKLLRVLQERKFRRIGGTVELDAGVRIIAATNRNLEEAVKLGEFREDLYYRLNVFPLFIPSLSERTEDIPDLLDHFLLKFHHTAGVKEGVMRKLMEYSWPGNIREFENCIERSVIMANGNILAVEHLPEQVRNNINISSPSVFTLPPDGLSLDELEKNLILQALSAASGNKTKAASLLGISRRALYSRMNTHGLPVGKTEETD